MQVAFVDSRFRVHLLFYLGSKKLSLRKSKRFWIPDKLFYIFIFKKRCVEWPHRTKRSNFGCLFNFSNVAIYVGYNETPTSQTVDNYMAHLRSIIQEGSPENAGLIAAARDIISRLNYSA